MGKGQAAILLLIIFALLGCAAPPLRPRDQFPHAEVSRRIQCELYKAVASTYNLQQTPFFKSQATKQLPVRERFALQKYVAKVTLLEKSERSAGAALGGFINDHPAADDRTVRRLGIGGADFGAIGAADQGSRSHQGERTIKFADILKDMNDKNGFGNTCLQAPVKGVPVGQQLGIVSRLNETLSETNIAPASIANEIYTFDFQVVVTIGGNLYFINPIRELQIGAGIKQVYNETVTIEIAPEAEK